ncbi:hypothetical protein KUTeg_020688 [Tegillarca granosa]|uniref:RNA-binding protein 15 n=1 Tax=Tegillarca granosa TaxID=220873 RepID=A0ABQ9E8N2_TEGGR|nr:hypothetical protein KUTeg_020688 [Tegillarca granosa]
MKRSQDREGSPRSKRPRSGYIGSDHESLRDRMSPDYPDSSDRRDGRGREHKYRDFDHELDRGRSKYRDDRMGDDRGGFMPMPRTENLTPYYRSLCISNITSKISDLALKDTLYREFKKFGEFNVNIVYSGEQRVAYINFRYPEDAKIAKHSKVGKLMIFDRPVRLDSVYQKRKTSPNPDFEHRGGYRGFGRGSSPYRGKRPYQNRYNPGPIPGGRDMPPQGDRDRGEFNPGHPHFHKNQRSEKFPYHLDHILPEDDENATRTLFVGNLDYNIADLELKKLFERYGPIEDIDIKRPQKGQGNAYAFIRFFNLDYAHRAKVEMSGQYIGRFQCKIGYGKVTATTCLWVGGLGPWVTHETLEREFDRFGAIERIEWPHGKDYAYVLYGSIDAAQAAIQEMRGCPLGGPDKRLRVDFADASHIGGSPVRAEPAPSDSGRSFQGQGGQWRQYEGQSDRSPRRREDWQRDDPVNSYRNPDNPRDFESRGYGGDWDNDRQRKGRSPDDFDRNRKHSRTPDKFYDKDIRTRDNSGQRYSQERDVAGNEDGQRRLEDGRRNFQSDKEIERELEKVEDIAELSRFLPVAMNGALILKNSAFATRMHVVSGDVTLVDNLMRDPTSTETPVLRIRQRLRLDQPKLEDVGRRVSSAGPRGHCVLLGMPTTLQNYEDPTNTIQQRPLKNLVTYLRQKDAAGVISLPPYDCKDKDNVGVLYSFPPCQWGYNYLISRAPRLPSQPIQDDYLVMVVIVGAS